MKAFVVVSKHQLDDAQFFSDAFRVNRIFQDEAGNIVYEGECASLASLADVTISWCQLPEVRFTQSIIVLKTLFERSRTGIDTATLATVSAKEIVPALTRIEQIAEIVAAYLVASTSDFILLSKGTLDKTMLNGISVSIDGLWVLKATNCLSI